MTGDAMRALLAKLSRDWRGERDDRLCREIVARGICAPTSDLGIAVRATLARVDALRVQRDDAERRWEDAVLSPDGTGALGEVVGECMFILGVRTHAGAVAAVRALRDETATLRGIHRDMLRVVGERDDARRELASLRESVKDVARRMAEQISEVSNG